MELQDAVDLAAGDITGQSDPYCIVSVADSAWTSKVQRFTRAPVWRERARLFVREPGSATLRVRVMDEDLLKEDDTLGVAAAALGPLCDGQRHELSLPVQGGGAGPGGGAVLPAAGRHARGGGRRRRGAGGEHEANVSVWVYAVRSEEARADERSADEAGLKLRGG